MAGFALALLFSLVVSSASDMLRAGLIFKGDVNIVLDQELKAFESNAASPQHLRLEELERNMTTMFVSLPKTLEGRLTHQAVSYALHRFFVRRYGWFIRGLELNNASAKEWVPSYLEELVERKLGREGADLTMLASLAAVLEDLIHQEVVARLDTAYEMGGLGQRQALNRSQALGILETYYIAFLNSGDLVSASPEDLEAQKRDFVGKYVGWRPAEEWLHELTDAHLKPENSTSISFENLMVVLDRIGQDYHQLNDNECRDLKTELQAMQSKKPGRVRLSTFYSKGLYSHWDFSEKQEYLRTLGALDESDPKSTFVIIPNYIMSRTNCLDSSNLYSICCRNECEDLQDVLESDIGAATAKPERIAALVFKTVPDLSARSSTLLERLDEIASYHGGEVPLHGRLFSQWMHHVYPLECPFPHVLGTVNPLSPNDWISKTGHIDHRASTDEMLEHMASDTCAVAAEGGVDCAGESADLAWSDTEMLLTWERPVSQGQARVTQAATLSTAQAGRGSSTRVLMACIGLAAVMLCLQATSSNRSGKGHVRFTMVRRRLAALALLTLIAYAVGLLHEGIFLCILGCGLVSIMAAYGRAAVHKTGPYKGALEGDDKCLV